MLLKKHFIQLEIVLVIAHFLLLSTLPISVLYTPLNLLFLEVYVSYVGYISIHLSTTINLALHIVAYLLLILVPIQGFRYYGKSKSLIFLHLLLALLTGLNFALFIAVYPGFF